MSAKGRESAPKTGYLGIIPGARSARKSPSWSVQASSGAGSKAAAEVEKAAAEPPPETAEPETEEIGFGKYAEDAGVVSPRPKS